MSTGYAMAGARNLMPWFGAHGPWHRRSQTIDLRATSSVLEFKRITTNPGQMS